MNKDMVHQTPKEKAAYWQEHVQQWQNIGLSKRQYCRDHELRYDKFVWWCRKVEKGYTEVGCFAHARRKFYEADKAAPTAITKGAIAHIDTLFAIERTLRERIPDDATFAQQRKKEVMPVLNQLHQYCCAYKDSVLPKSLTGQAIEYCLGNGINSYYLMQKPKKITTHLYPIE